MSGDFWTLATAKWYEDLRDASQEGTVGQFIKTRVVKALFADEIPDPRDAIVICLTNACDVFRIMFELDEETEERIALICQMDPDRPVHSRGGRAEHRHPDAPAFHAQQEDTRRRPAPVAAQPAPSQRQHSRDLRGTDERIRPGVRGPPAVRETDDIPRRAGGEPLGAPAWADAPEGRGLFRGFRESLRRAWRIAGARRHRSFPPSQGDGAGQFARQAGGSAGRGVPPCPPIHGDLEGRRDLPRARLPAHDQRAALAALPRRRIAGHHSTT